MDRAELARLLGGVPGVGEPQDMTIAERDPQRFMDAFGRAVAAGGRVFLADPAWGQAERARFSTLVTMPAEGADTGWLCIPTGGSSGPLKLARHDEETLEAAVRGFSTYFGPGPINAVGSLPMHHVSGLMAWMRCVLTGGTYVPWNNRALWSGDRPTLGDGAWYLSLVPTQLARLLADDAAVAWLRGFRAVLVGGGPAWPELVAGAEERRLPLAFTYGMTETAAMVTALPPAEFLDGCRGCGRSLPHVVVSVADDGSIRIDGESLFRGYHPELRSPGLWTTEDLGRFDQNGSLHILGRRDGYIISGGEKIDPAEVENALRATGSFADIAVIGVPDAEWGDVLVACHPVVGEVDFGALNAQLAATLAPFKHPKRYVPVEPWPRNAQGKVNRAALRQAIAGGGRS